MIDTINAFNTTDWGSIQSIIYTGGNAATAPGYITETSTRYASSLILQYLRDKNPHVGLYYAIGTSDMYPHKYQDFQSSGSGSYDNLTNLDADINPDTSGYTSFAGNNAARDVFKTYGFYSLDSVVSTILADTSNPDLAFQGIENTFVKPIFLNTMACFNNNWELMREKGDPGA